MSYELMLKYNCSDPDLPESETSVEYKERSRNKFRMTNNSVDKKIKYNQDKNERN